MFGKLMRGKAVGVIEAAEMADAGGAVLIDVRTSREFKGGHAPGAKHISLASLEQQMARIPLDRPVLAICQSGNRSGRAVAMMRHAGIDARNVKGGMRAWAGADLPVTRR